MRRRGVRARVGHDRWLVSYADFITLLFGFFVVLYAFAKADEKKQVQVSQAIQAAFKDMGVFSSSSPGSSQSSRNAAAAAAMTVVMNANALTPALGPGDVKLDLERIQRELSLSLAKQVATHAVSIEMGRDGLVISLREAGFFASASAAPKPEALPTLREIAGTLGRTVYDVRIEGHTDNVPIHNAEFNSNWELSTARATSIARLFLGLNAIPPNRLSAAGYAEFHPVAPNDTPEGRALNRRVDLVVMPRTNVNFAEMKTSPPHGAWSKITDEDGK